MWAKTGRATVVAALVLALATVAPPPALADRPLRLDAQVTDRVNALGDRRAEVDAALARLRAETSLQLFVVYVRSFSGTPAVRWADETATRSDLGTGDGLLAVATGDRAYAYSFAQDFRLTDAQLANVAAVAIEPALAQNDWAGAVVGAADGYRAALTGRPVTAPNIVPGDPDPGGGAGRLSLTALGIGLLVVLGLVALAVALGVWLWLRSRRRAASRPALQPGAPTTQELSNRADSLLVELDNALVTSAQELDVAAGQYGSEATTPFAAALAAARQDVAEAFRVRQLVTESTDADEDTRRGRLSEIIRRCEAADHRLDAQSAAFDELRQLETNAERALAAAQARRAEVHARLPGAAETLDELRGRYGGPALAAVSGNVTEAQGRLDFAAGALSRAAEALGRGDRAPAAVAVRGAEEALAQAVTLLDALRKVCTDLDEARAGVAALLAEVDADVAAGRAALDGRARGGLRSGAGTPDQAAGPAGAAAPGPPGVAAPGPAGAAAPGTDAGAASGPDGTAEAERMSLAAAVERAEATAAAVRNELAGPTADPLAALRRLREVDDAIDRALAGVRDAAERARRARAMLDHAVLAARSEISAAADFIATRRGAVGSEARTRLAEAQRHLDRAIALAADDPVAALAAAQQADALAQQAARTARSDVDRWPVAAGGYGHQDPLGGLAGAILGGILIGGMGGGGSRRGGGWGGGWSPGSFGGTGTRMRRGGGGRF